MKLSHLLVLGATFLCSVSRAETGVTGMTGVVNPFVCGPIQNAYGPFDYRTAASPTKHGVEDHHFTPQVEQLKSGQSGYLGGDLDYTLRVFPNSPRALMSVARLVNKVHSTQLQGATYPAECYFERAIRFQPRDPMPRLIYATYLKDRGRKEEAMRQLDEASEVRGDTSNFDLDYNLGLLYFDFGAYDKAAVAARRAYALGAPLPGLAAKLKKVGKWQEPPPAAPTAAPPTQAVPMTAAPPQAAPIAESPQSAAPAATSQPPQ